MQQLYGLGPSAGERAEDRRHRDPEARALFERWLVHGERFDADPDGWHRDRLNQSVRAIGRTQGPERARALALQLVARGSLSREDIPAGFRG